LLVIAVSFAVVASIGVVVLKANRSLGSREKEPLTCRVVRGDFAHEVSVEGEVESAVNVEVRCEVQPESSHWIRILEVVPEGTHVKPGDFLVRLDSSGLEVDRERQQITCEQIEAATIQARRALDTVTLARDAYLSGEFKLAEEQAKVVVMVAEDAERRAREFYESSSKLEQRGYITDLQLRADEYAWKAAKTELSLAKAKLAVLERFTKPVRMTQLNAAVISAKARLAATECSRKLAIQRLEFIGEQIRKCVIRAPVSGQVVLAHLLHYGHNHMIEPGAETFQKRVLVRLPDFRSMQVAAMIDEDKIALVQPRLAVSVRLPAFPGVTIPGRVVKINEYPEPEDWMGSSVKKYKAVVSLQGPPQGSRPGMTADVAIHLNRLPNRIQVPCPAVIHHGDRDYCIGYKGDRFELRPVSLGPNNGVNVVIREGLKEGEEVVLSAAAHRDMVQLPELKRRAPGAKSLTAAIPPARREGVPE
jgi:multidrug efflux pump subunit AcrA (membrane-fusion protein)